VTTQDGHEARPALDELCRGAADLLRIVERPLRRLTVRVGDAAVEMEWPGRVAPPPATAASGAPGGADADGGPLDGVHVVAAPHVGTFYRRPEPGAEPFVVEGSAVRRGQQVGILEAMKLMNPVEADRDGRVVEFLVADGDAVEFDQPLLTLAVDEDGGRQAP
jgi:acetyl-CoA carboxylase biotin carboxyl carrier protein